MDQSAEQELEVVAAAVAVEGLSAGFLFFCRKSTKDKKVLIYPNR